MRILQVINSLATGGAEKTILDSLPRYIEKGIDMEVLVLNGKEYPFYKKLKSTTNCEFYDFGKGSVYNPFHIFKIIPFLSKFDIIHVHLFPSLYWVSLAKMISFSKVPIIFTEHNITNRRRTPILKYFDRFIYREYQYFITISDEVDILLKKHLNFKESKYRKIKNGVDLKKIDSVKPKNRYKLGIDVETKVIIQVSSFTSQKDQKTLIKSIPYLKENIKLLLVGDGVLIEECKQLVSKLNLCKKVSFLGIRMDVIELLKMSDLIVLSTNYEGLSLSCIEALSSGKPFLASDVTGVSQIVEGAGILFPNGNEKKLAEEINHLFSDKFYYENILKKCLERSKQFSIEKMINESYTLYDQISSNKK